MILKIKYDANTDEEMVALNPSDEFCVICKLYDKEDGLLYYGILKYTEEVKDSPSGLFKYKITFLPVVSLNPNKIIYIKIDNAFNDAIYDLNDNTAEETIINLMHSRCNNKEKKFERFNNK